MNYRKIWIQANGPIPLDDQGRSYEIHHIDGDRKNNRLENLQCLSIEAHYELHYSKGEYFAATLIAKRLGKFMEKPTKYNITPEHREKIRQAKLGDKNPMKNPQVAKKVADALRGRIKPEAVESRRLLTRKHNNQPWHTEETKSKMRKPKEKVQCMYCNTIGGISQMKRWHFENCKLKTNNGNK